MIRRLSPLLLAVLAACDSGNRVSPGGGTASLTLKGKRFDVQLVLAEKERKRALLGLPAAADGKGALLGWPRERFMKLEPEYARASFDAVFLDRSVMVVDIALLERGDKRGVMPATEAAWVLLLAPATAKALDLKPGDAADFSPDIKAAKPLDLAVVQVGGATAYAELALTEAERQHGLMWRPRMSADDGMLFGYRDEFRRSFWMGNTLIPLDIAFIKADGTLLNVNETPIYPDPTSPPSPYPTSDSKGDAQFVLEMNLGWFKRKGLVDDSGYPKPGVKVILPPEALRGSE